MARLLPDWYDDLPLQQQSVLLLAARGPDGIPKSHPCKNIQRAYRASVMVAGRFNRMLRWGEHADSFMSLERFASQGLWAEDIKTFFETVDELPHHFTMHLMHGAQILGYKHPDPRFRAHWLGFYLIAVVDLHLNPESEDEMDERLNDWGRAHWEPVRADT